MVKFGQHFMIQTSDDKSVSSIASEKSSQVLLHPKHRFRSIKMVC